MECEIESKKENHQKEYKRLEEDFKSTESELKEELREKLLCQYAKQDKIEEKLNDLKRKNEE